MSEASLEFSSYPYKGYDFIQDTEGHIYNDNSEGLIRGKCFALTLGTPITTAIRSLYHLGATLIKMLWYPFEVLCGKMTKEDAWDDLMTSAADIFRSIYYGVAMTGAAIMGIVCPNEGRYHYGIFERTLNRDGFWDHSKFYLARCFQPITSTTADNRDEILDKFIARNHPPERAGQQGDVNSFACGFLCATCLNECTRAC